MHGHRVSSRSDFPGGDANGQQGTGTAPSGQEFPSKLYVFVLLLSMRTVKAHAQA